MATTSTRTTKKASSTPRSAARKTTGAARKTASTAKKTASTAKKATKSATKSVAKSAKKATKSTAKAAKKSTTAAKSRATSTVRAAAKRTSGAASTAKRSASQRTAAKKSTSKRSSSTRSTSRGPDALQLLIDDHRTVEALFKKFEGLGDRANKAREEIVTKVIEELSVHAVIEEQAFYPAIRTQAKTIEDDVLEALEEHHVVKWVLSELEKMSSSDERYEAKFTVLMEAVRHHVEEEESDMFPKVRRALSREQLQAIGAALAEAKMNAPRRPHPRSPDTPPGNLIAGALSAPLDAARSAGADALDAARNAGQNAVDSVREFASRATGGGNNGRKGN